ncbi:hypothetical protein [Halorarius litoreus]|uniref:hypothetical protein n=1 Tax=Halorarius litoreus TaxID=2962676 RepID=UPI0020CE9427|nr:hypothetical protein [Halorarius litoreus]
MATDTGDRVSAAEALVSHLVASLTALAAGVVAGGWLAFETAHWRGFKELIEGLAGTALFVVVALLTVAVAVTALATYAEAANA